MLSRLDKVLDDHGLTRGSVVGVIFLVVSLAWAYAAAGYELWNRWSTDPAYGHGYFVPLVAAYLLWHRRDKFQPPYTGSWWGLLLIGLAMAMRFASHYWYYTLLDAYSIVPMVAGLCLLIIGWRGLRWCWPAVLFLVFMVPLPGRVADLLAQPLQRVATIASTYLIQLAGIPAVPEGNVIVLTDAKVGVVEACNGLRMLVLFFAVAAAVTLMTNRPMWIRALLLASAVPVALLANVIRITATAMAYEYASPALADHIFHGVAAWLMMPVGILLLCLELAFLDRVFPEVERRRPLTTA